MNLADNGEVIPIKLIILRLSHAVLINSAGLRMTHRLREQLCRTPFEMCVCEMPIIEGIQRTSLCGI